MRGALYGKLIQEDIESSSNTLSNGSRFECGIETITKFCDFSSDIFRGKVVSIEMILAPRDAFFSPLERYFEFVN